MLSRIIHILSKPLTGGNQLYFLLMYLLGLTGIICEPWNGSRFWMSFELFSAHPTNPVECCADANPKTMLPNDT